MQKDFFIRAIEKYCQYNVLIKSRKYKFIHVKRVLKVNAIYVPFDNSCTPYQALLDGLRSEYTAWKQVGHKSINDICIDFEVYMFDGPKRIQIRIVDYDFTTSFRMIEIKQMYGHLY